MSVHSYSMVIRNARIVDGSGVPSFKGDLAVAGDRIAAIGKVSGRGDVEIDAAGQVLAPGFIDIHTHYDPQLCWDRLAVPSPEHGVTSIVIGNCSMSLAPVRPDSRENLIGWFGSVEDMGAGCSDGSFPSSGKPSESISPSCGVAWGQTSALSSAMPFFATT